MVQWLGLGTLTSRAPGSIPGPGAKISPFTIILRIQWISISSTIGDASEWTRATKKGQGQMACTNSPSAPCVDYSDWYCSAISKGKGANLLGVVLPPNPRVCFLRWLCLVQELSPTLLSLSWPLISLSLLPHGQSGSSQAFLVSGPYCILKNYWEPQEAFVYVGYISWWFPFLQIKTILNYYSFKKSPGLVSVIYCCIMYYPQT